MQPVTDTTYNIPGISQRSQHRLIDGDKNLMLERMIT
jgi:hypothetical protein